MSTLSRENDQRTPKPRARKLFRLGFPLAQKSIPIRLSPVLSLLGHSAVATYDTQSPVILRLQKLQSVCELSRPFDPGYGRSSTNNAT